MRALTLIQKFSLLCFLALLLFAVVFGFVVTSSLEENMVSRTKDLTAKIISDEVRRGFSAGDFDGVKSGVAYDEFSQRLERIVGFPHIERLKVWSPEAVVLWADSKEVVGQSFPDNADFLRAARGEVVSEISGLGKAENEHERVHGRLLELYVPVSFSPGSEVTVIFEIYQNLTTLFEDIAAHKRMVWTAILAGFLLLYMVLFGVVWGASRMIERQHLEIARSEERYRSLIAAAHDGIISMDQEGRIVLFNDAAQRIFLRSAREMLGRSPEDLMPEDYRGKHREGMEGMLAGAARTIMGRTVEMKGIKKDGEIFPVDLSLSVSGNNGDLLVTGIIRDITERRAMQDQLINSEKLATVAIIAGSIGHEINNTVAGLMGYAELLRADPDNGRLVRKSAEVFTTQTDRLRLHGQNLLRLSKPRDPEMMPLDVNAFVERVTDLLVVCGTLKMYEIRKIFSPDLPRIMGDETLLEQVFRNLEINASHAMGSHGVLTLRTELSADGLYAELTVEDTGQGIPADKQEKVFLPFYTTKEKGKGTGLGMYIVKQIVEQHRGHVRLESEEGKGTAVTVSIPVIT